MFGVQGLGFWVLGFVFWVEGLPSKRLARPTHMHCDELENNFKRFEAICQFRVSGARWALEILESPKP